MSERINLLKIKIAKTVNAAKVLCTQEAIVLTKTNFTSQGVAITGELYTPAAATNTGLVVIAYGSDGLTDHLTGPWETMIRDYAESLAESGFVALIPDFLAVTGTTPGKTVLLSLIENRDIWQTALSDAIDHGKGLPSVDATRIGLLGFSLGGHLCLRVRAKAKILVEYFAPALDGIGFAGKLTHAQIHHGKADHFPGTGFANAKAINDELEREGTSTELFAYSGAGHGFIGSDQANSNARKQSKKTTLTFFQTHL
tara:strand:- start:1945 stop:2712 length:768 start_codon:yes stop_codon:yes gene_type:complete